MSQPETDAIRVADSISWPRELLALAAVMLVCTGTMFYSTKQWLLPPDVGRQYRGDYLAIIASIQNMLETGSHQHSHRLGMPLGTDWSAYPSSSGWLNWTLMRGLGAINQRPFWILNLFYWLTFPLTGAIAHVVCRRLGIALLPAMMTAILYSSMSYHYNRDGHLFLAAYYGVPVGILAAIRLWNRTNEPIRPTFSLAALAGMAIFTALGNVYYTVFIIWVMLAIGLARGFHHRSARPLALAVLWCGLATGTFALTALPDIKYQLNHLKNADRPRRSPGEGEVYGLKPIQLFLPPYGHPLRSFAGFHKRYQAETPLSNENVTASLGIVGSIGLLALLGRFLFRRPGDGAHETDAMSFIAVILLCLVTIGGLGSVINWLQAAIKMDPWIRGYNRGSIMIAFVALLWVGCFFNRVRSRITTRGGAILYHSALAAVTAWGVFDETPRGKWLNFEKSESLSRQDAEYFRDLEARHADGAFVFMMDYRYFPECGIEPLTDYSHFRPYFNTRSMTFNYGSLKGEANDVWYHQLTDKPPAEIADHLARMEAAGILLFRPSLGDRGRKLEQELTKLLGTPPLTHPSGEFVFFDLGPMTAKLKSATPPEIWEKAKRRLQNPIVPEWKEPFGSDMSGTEAELSKITRQIGTNSPIVIRNRLDEDRRLKFRCRIGQNEDKIDRETTWVKITTPGGSEILEVPPDGLDLDTTFEAPPGEVVIRFSVAGTREELVNASVTRRVFVRMSNVSFGED